MSGSLPAPAQLLERASRLACLDDFGPDILPALEAFCLFFGELSLTEAGRRNLEVRATQSLITRLRLIQVRKERSEIFDVPLADPVIIVGMPRAGTTFLYELFAKLPGRRPLLFWEAHEPIADKPDHRRRYYETLTKLKLAAIPELAVKHPIDPQGPEECIVLLDASLASISFVFGDVPSPRYFSWLFDEQRREPYLIYRQLLQYLQSEQPHRRFVLKSPGHLGMIGPLASEVPNACLVHIHRDPIQVLPSLCSLSETLSRASLSSFDRRQQGLLWLSFLERMLACNAEQRQKLSPSQYLDLTFNEVTTRPLETVRRIHEHFGLAFGEAEERVLAAETARGAPPEVGRHHYRLEDYGVTADEVAERLASYRERFGFA